jgi:Holliday junction resolvasome RuvABC endonuclease subunit
MRFAAKGASHGAILGHALEMLTTFMKDNPVDHLVIEQEVRKRQSWKSSIAADTLLIKLIGIAEAVTFNAGVYRPAFAPVNTVRKFFLGDGSLDRDTAKHRTVQRCEALGWAPADDNAADALAIWAWRCSIIDPTFGTTLSPLFGKRRIAAA